MYWLGLALLLISEEKEISNNIGIYIFYKFEKLFKDLILTELKHHKKIDMMSLDIKYKLYSIIFIFDVNNYIGYIQLVSQNKRNIDIFGWRNENRDIKINISIK